MKTTAKQRPRSWQRVLRPLLWWVVLVLVLYAHRSHERLLLNTRLSVVPWLGNRSVGNEAQLKLDGRFFSSGEQIPLGWHSLSVSHPRADQFVTNLFMWYGRRDLGRIDLKRAVSTLAVAAEPPAALLRIRGSEFSATYTNSAGMTSAVPTDRYTIEAEYAYWRGTEDAVVAAGRTTSRRFAPRMGGLRLTSNRPETGFKLEAELGHVKESGTVPVTIANLPAGAYRVVAEYEGDVRPKTVDVSAGQTNEADFQFVYGGVELRSQPAGAQVTALGGRHLGMTPLELPRLAPGRWELKLTLEGYLPVNLDVEVLANQTNAVSTNLVNAGYAEAMAAARSHWAQGNAMRSLEALERALKIRPTDPEALALQREAGSAKLLADTREFAKTGDFASARQAVEKLLALVPAHPEGSALVKVIEAGEVEQQKRAATLERNRASLLAEQRRTNQTFELELAFYQTLKEFRPAELAFQRNELRTARPVTEVADAIYKELSNEEPRFTAYVERNSLPDKPLAIVGRQELPGGRRQCIIVAGQLAPGETVVLFKVVEYKGEAANYVAIEPYQPERLPAKQRTQLQEGIKLVRERLERAIEGR